MRSYSAARIRENPRSSKSTSKAAHWSFHHGIRCIYEIASSDGIRYGVSSVAIRSDSGRSCTDELTRFWMLLAGTLLISSLRYCRVRIARGSTTTTRAKRRRWKRSVVRGRHRLLSTAGASNHLYNGAGGASYGETRCLGLVRQLAAHTASWCINYPANGHPERRSRTASRWSAGTNGAVVRIPLSARARSSP